MADKAVPLRSCIYCRATKEKRALLRFVLAPDRMIVPDLQEKLPGRGAYTCIRVACLKGAAIKKQFQRCFRGEVTGADAEGLIATVRARIQERVASYISLAYKAGKVVSGTDMVVDTLKHAPEKFGLFFVASDVSEDIGQKVRVVADRAGIPCCGIFDKERLGALIGKGLRSVVAIEESGFIRSLNQEIEKFMNFSEEDESR